MSTTMIAEYLWAALCVALIILVFMFFGVFITAAFILAIVMFIIAGVLDAGRWFLSLFRRRTK